MAFDGIVTKALVDELNDKLEFGKVNKVYQPENDEIILHIRAKGENHMLLMSANSNSPGFHLTNLKKKNPMEAPMFCMVLRKHLIGGSILDIRQLSMDRIVEIDIEAMDELGLKKTKTLIIEVMGRHSNIILINKEDKKVIESINRVYEDMSRVRQIFPGSLYFYPPSQDKLDPLTTSRESFLEVLEKSEDLPIFKFFYFNFLGLSPIISREFCHIAKIDKKTKISELTEVNKEELFQAFSSEMEKIKNKDYKPNLIYNSDRSKILGFHALDLNQFQGEKLEFQSISELLDKLYVNKGELDRVSQKSQSLVKITKTNLERAKNKLKKQEKEYEASLDRDIYKVYADLLSANFHKIKAGSKSISLENFYDEDLKTIEIPLDEKKSGPLNAQFYYKKYSKLKNASNLLKIQIPETKDEILYLENILLGIEHSQTNEDLEEIRQELTEEGYIKKNRKKRRDTLESKPHRYISSDGMDIYVGKNNRQNDNLTFKISSRNDTWLHTQNRPGSHVIIRNNGEKIPEKTLLEAASLAGYYSSSRGDTSVPIDYTERKNVKKPKAAKAGMVIYEDFQTIFVDPSEKSIKDIKIHK